MAQNGPISDQTSRAAALTSTLRLIVAAADAVPEWSNTVPNIAALARESLGLQKILVIAITLSLWVDAMRLSADVSRRSFKPGGAVQVRIAER